MRVIQIVISLVIFFTFSFNSFSSDLPVNHQFGHFSKIFGKSNEYQSKFYFGNALFDNSGYLIQNIRRIGSNNDLSNDSISYQINNIRVNFKNCNEKINITPEFKTDSYSNYFVGSDPDIWETNIFNYESLYYSELYDKIDLRFVIDNSSLKYDIILKPGSDISNIVLDYQGLDRLDIDDMGNLKLVSGAGELIEFIPRSYQIIDNKEIDIKVVYYMQDKFSIGFQAIDYNPNYDLIIDPLIYSTFIGGTGQDYLWGGSIQKDATDNIYITGRTTSNNFPTTPGTYDVTFNGNFDGFIIKMNSLGTAPIFSTYFGGSSSDVGSSIYLDSFLNFYICGTTASANFPITPGVFQTSKSGGDDGYILKMNSSGNALIYSTYIGGLGNDYPWSLVADVSGNAYFITETNGFFPTTVGAFDVTYNGGPWDAAVTKINNNGTGLIYSTYLGSNGDDNPSGIVIDSGNNVYISGYTSGNNFPVTAGVYSQVYGGGVNDCFVTKLNPAGNSLVYSTYIGGSGNDINWNSIALTSGNELVFGGYTSGNYPTTPGAYLNFSSGSNTAFVSKLSNSGNSLLASTYIGGSGSDQVYYVSLDQNSRVYTTGTTTSTNFPIVGCVYDSTANGLNDAFLSVFNANLSMLEYSTYIGGSLSDKGSAIIAENNFAYLIGETGSVNYPTTTGAFDETFNGGSLDVFLTKIELANSLVVNFTNTNNVCYGSPITFTNNSSGATNYLWDFGDSNSSNLHSPSHTYSSPGNYNVILTAMNSCSSNTFIQAVVILPLPTLTIGAISSVCINSQPIVLSSGSPLGGIYSGVGVTGNNFDPAISGIGTHSIIYSITDLNGCTNSSSTDITVYPIPIVSLAPLSSICQTSSAFALTGGLPAGGVYSGPGVSSNMFDPSVAGVGIHTINYTYVDINGCVGSDNSNIQVISSSTVLLNPFSPVCISNTAFPLSGGSPLGGIYSGAGISSNVFDPSLAGAGTHLITYTFTDLNGCSNFITNSILVNTLPAVSFANLNPVCINSPQITLNTGLPLGGTYSGTGVSGIFFNPTIAGLGTHTITYTFSDINGCLANASTNILVNQSPIVSLSVFNAICNSSSSFLLSGGLPAGGVYSGPGVSSNMFDPFTAGVGIHTINYTYVDINGCAGSDNSNIQVITSSTVLMNPFNPVCISNTAFPLSGGTPLGGTYSGPGISTNIFDPSLAGAGSHLITYTFTDMNGCSNSSTASIIVNPLPLITVGSLNAVCVNSPLINLNSGLPLGGIYSGNGVSGNFFNPAVANLGTHTITYTFSDLNGCTANATTNILVSQPPIVSFSAVNSVCSSSSSFLLTGGLPVGGTYSGNGVATNFFNPSLAGVGIHTIVYSFVDINGCQATASSSIEVIPTPAVTFSSVNPICISAGSFVLSGVSPIGGIFSGSGISGNTFIPSIAGIGNHIINYSFTDNNNCTGTALSTIQVMNIPQVTINTQDSLCVNSAQITLTGGFPAGGVYSGTGVTANQFDPSIAGVGTHMINYFYTDIFGCSNIDSSAIIVLPDSLLNLSIQIGTDTTLCKNGINNSIILFGNSSLPNYLWSNGSTLSQLTVSQSGWYWLQSKFVCESVKSDSIFVDECIVDTLVNIFTPNSFTPNGDGVNDLFIPIGNNIVIEKLSVFSRWGDLIYTSSNTMGWDGTKNDEFCPVGVYIYKVTYITYNGSKSDKIGRVSLIR